MTTAATNVAAVAIWFCTGMGAAALGSRADTCTLQRFWPVIPQGSPRGVPVLDVHDKGAAVGGRNEQRGVVGAERQAGDGRATAPQLLCNQVQRLYESHGVWFGYKHMRSVTLLA